MFRQAVNTIPKALLSDSHSVRYRYRVQLREQLALAVPEADEILLLLMSSIQAPFLQEPDLPIAQCAEGSVEDALTRFVVELAALPNVFDGIRGAVERLVLHEKVSIDRASDFMSIVLGPNPATLGAALRSITPRSDPLLELWAYLTLYKYPADGWSTAGIREWQSVWDLGRDLIHSGNDGSRKLALAMLASVHKNFPWKNRRRRRELAESIQLFSLRLGRFDLCPEVRLSALAAIGIHGSGFCNRSPYNVPLLVQFIEHRATVEHDEGVLRRLGSYSESFASDLYYNEPLQRRMQTVASHLN